MICVFRHRPVRYGQVSPQIRRMRHAEAPVFRLRPVFRLAIAVRIRRDHLALEHHRLDIEVIVIADCEKPDVFRAVLPVGLRAASLLTLPRDPVLRNEIFFTNTLYRRRAAPIAADINRRRGLEYPDGLRQPRVEPFRVFVDRCLLEFAVVEALREVVRRIGEHQIHGLFRQERECFENVLTEDLVTHIFETRGRFELCK